MTALDHETVIIGAGLGGIGAGIALKRAGLDDFVVLERADDVGGTWRENTYPDIGVDVPSFAYQFSFEKNPYWSRVFPKGAEVKRYIDHCADKYGVRPHIRLNSEVTRREWDGDTHTWLTFVGKRRKPIRSRWVIAALGAFVNPRPPGIPGLEDFERKLVRSQAWDHEYEFAGKRIGVIGTGASAVQLIPPLGEVAQRLYVFQRRPIWVFAKADPEIPGIVQQVFRHVPGVQEAVRLGASALVELGLVGISLYGRRIAPLSQGPALACRAYLRTQVADPELRAKLTPEYGFGCKRPAMSNTYYRTFTRENCELVTDPIERVTATGIRTADGIERELDALVLATGFRLSHEPENYRASPVHGPDGFDLADFVEREPLQAYEGVSLPQLPNSFSIFGPYSWTGSSWHVMVETQSHHAVRVMQEARRRGATMVAVSQDANDRFHRFVSERAKGTLHYSNNCSSSNSYYLDHHGDFSLLRPTTALEAWWASRNFPLDDYEYAASRMSRLPKPRDGAAALVTGASAGIGTELARELASRGHTLILVARRLEQLQALGEELSAAHGIRAEALSCDLADPAAREELPDRIADLELDVDVLVNNAGFATGGPFHESDTGRELMQVRVLCEAPVALCSAFLPAMVERRSGAVLNVASTAGMQPLPYSAGYGAAKAHALSFSQALHEEMRRHNITVTALCPGPVSTDFWDLAGEQPIESAIPRPLWVSAKQAASAGIKGLDSGHRVVVPGLPVRLGVEGGRMVPNMLKLPLLERMMRRRG